MSSELAALGFGTAAGIFAQFVLIARARNGEWSEISKRRKFALSMTGGIAAFVVGLLYLAAADTSAPVTLNARVYYRMWALQTLAGWGAAGTLDAMQNGLPKWLKLIMEALMKGGGNGRG